MNAGFRLCIACAATIASASAVAGTTFFEGENFGGRQFTVDRPMSHFGANGQLERARSAIVEGDSWEFCIDNNFSGCAVLAPGRYPNLGEFAGRVGSARPVGYGPAALSPPSVATQATAGVTFYRDENFGGRQITIDQALANFEETRFNDRANSAIVAGGTWEICVDAGYRGECKTFAPGSYPTLGGLGGRVSSARPLREVHGDAWRDGHRGRARASLYSGQNMTGRAFALGGEAVNLDGLFNDRASSLRVDAGYWIFCSDANFRGECRTFGPGEYPTLPPELDNRISSGRRISNDYPYSSGPQWR